MPHASFQGSCSSNPPILRVWLLLGAWFLLSARPGRAENAVSYKYADYREEGGRIAVKSHYGQVDQDLGTDMHLSLMGVVDSIAGATPNGQPPPTPGADVPLTNLHDRRKAWSGDFSRQFSRVKIDVGYANSRESDYVSNGWSLNTLTDFNQKNTTLLLGAAGTDDDVRTLFQSPWLKKRGLDLITGVTQLLDPVTTVSFDLGFGRATGYLADPYRVIQQVSQVAPGIYLPFTYGENRPDSRDKWTALASINHSFVSVHGTVEASYRFYHDTFGTRASTIELAWFQKLGEHLTLRPYRRFYDPTAADFYRVDVTGANFTPTGKPMPGGPYFSSDYRLSALRSYDYGLKAIVTLSPAWQLDVAYDRYEMHGKDSVTSASAYPKANIVTTGLKFSW